MHRFAALLALAALSGCNAPEFESTPSLVLDQSAAEARDVVVVADADVAPPADGGVLPILVTVRNMGERPVSLDYGLFTLIPHPLGAEYAALPPDGAPGELDAETLLAAVPFPRLERMDLAGKALPRGRLAPGEVASGYLYFQKPIRPGATMDLQAQIVDAETGATIATVTLPMRPPGGELAGAPLAR